MIGLSTLYADFTKSGDIVKDNEINLEWQDNTEGSGMIWEVAITHCETLTLEGYSDWRLPNVNELRRIVDRSKFDPAIVTGFTNVSLKYYWSSSTYEGLKEKAWTVDFEYGRVSPRTKNSPYYVRCIRDGQ